MKIFAVQDNDILDDDEEEKAYEEKFKVKSCILCLEDNDQ